MVFLFIGFTRLLSGRYLKPPKIIMPSQTKISSFFCQSTSASPAFQDKMKNTCPNSSNENKEKKVKGQIEQEEIKEPAQKKVKLSESSEKQSSSVELSDNDRKRVQQNKLAAKIKLIGGKTGGLVQNVGHSWFSALEPEFSKEYFIKLGKFIAEERNKGTIYPPPEQVFSWTRTCPIDSVKVVIIGQDPYHGPRQAHGLCFSVLPGVKPPPSLENMFKELESSIEGFKRPAHGNLIGWANQGVLLLNACLTVRAGQANSHADKGWEKLTDAVIQWLNLNMSGLVFMLWGAYAQKKGACINTKKHHILKSVHPSPLSAHRGFLGCRHFSLCNELLSSAGRSPIDWTHLPEREEEDLK